MSGSAFARLARIGDVPLLHPILFAAYPVVFLWAQNVHEDPSSHVALELIAIMVAGTLAVISLTWLAVRDLRRAAFVGSAVVGSFAAFGRVATEFGVPPIGPEAVRFLVGWLLATAALVTIGCFVRRRALGLTQLLNAIAAALVAFNLVPIVGAAFSGSSGPTAAWRIDPASLNRTAAGPARDVYYLIFDRYAGEQPLRDLYGYDDSAFLRGLESRGFVVDHGAVANYPQTSHSLASSLNMTYLDDLAVEVGESSSDWGPLRGSLHDTTLSRAFVSMGYTYVHLGSWWTPTWDDPTADINYVYGGLSEFSGAYWDTTMAGWLEQRFGLRLAPDDRVVQWNRVHFQVEKVEATARDPDPTFTFAHFTLPHTPYVFHADGSLTDPGYRPSEVAYVDQLRYTNTVIDALIDDILGQPGPTPIIVVQSDEGPHPPEFDYAANVTWSWPEQSDVELGRKLHILEAVYLPDTADRSAFGDITPVNTFRLIFDRYFGANLPRLPDRTYAWTDFDHPYRFVDVTDRLVP